MTLRKFLPTLSLILLSIFAILFAFAFLWILDVDSPTVEAQLASTIRLAIPSSIMLIILLWFGAGVDALLSRIANRAKRIWTSLLVYLILPVTLCLVLPALVIMLFSGVFVNGWDSNSGFGAGLFMTIALIPAVTGFFFIYLGAGVHAAARWLAGKMSPAVE